MYDQYSAKQEAVEISLAQSENLVIRYTNELKRAKANVERLEKLLALLDANPQVTEIIQLMGRG